MDIFKISSSDKPFLYDHESCAAKQLHADESPKHSSVEIKNNPFHSYAPIVVFSVESAICRSTYCA